MDIHAITDLETMRTDALRQCDDALALLDVMPHALANGRLEVIREYIERVTEHVERAYKRLDDGKNITRK